MPRVVFKNKQVIIGGFIHAANKPIEVTDKLAEYLVSKGAEIVQENGKQADSSKEVKRPTRQSKTANKK